MVISLIIAAIDINHTNDASNTTLTLSLITERKN